MALLTQRCGEMHRRGLFLSAPIALFWGVKVPNDKALRTKAFGCRDITALRHELAGLKTETLVIYLNTLPLSSMQPY